MCCRHRADPVFHAEASTRQQEVVMRNAQSVIRAQSEHDVKISAQTRETDGSTLMGVIIRLT